MGLTNHTGLSSGSSISTQGGLNGAGGLNSPISPDMVSNLSLWIDAADTSMITATGALVDQINDKSGNGNNVTGATTTRPDSGTVVVNGLNTIDFDGTGEYLAVPTLNLTIGYELIFVIKPANDSANSSILGSRTSNASGYSFFLRTTINQEYAFTPDAAIASGLRVGNRTTDTQLLRCSYDGVTAEIFRDSTSLGSKAETDTVSQPTNLAFGLIAGVTAFEGQLCEMVIYNKTLDSLEISSIENYLTNKWGI